MTKPALIALDWGTSNLRASLLDEAGCPLDTRSAAGGIMAVPERRFADALRSLCGDWIDTHRCALVASGMIGSRQGWQEAPYLVCPAGLAEAAAQLTAVPVDARTILHIVPGLRCESSLGMHDVMRGEETQFWGAELPAGSCCVLPGTHSKWAFAGERGTLQRFQTFMTGELYAVLTQHSILGRLMQPGSAQPAAFEAGARLGLAEHARLPHTLFAARTAGLMGELPPEALPDYLSGILIGAEIGGASAAERPDTVALLGDDALCARYEAALRLAGIASTRVEAGATTRGQWRLARQAGLV